MPTDNQLQHYGVLGMHWGRRKANPSFKESNYASENSKTIKVNKDGSKTIPPGFTFNRIGKSSMDINQSGVLYVSHGKEDAARYIKSLGPTTLGKLLGTAGEAVQQIKVKSALKMPSDSDIVNESAKLLLSNKKVLSKFNDSIYSAAYTKSFDKDITSDDLRQSLKDPLGPSGQRLSYALSSALADPNFANESKVVYEHFRSKGYDALPDVHDILSGTSNTAMIVINPSKLEITTTTTITKDVLRSGKEYVKTLEKLKTSELIE